MTQHYASRLALLAFATAVIRGLALADTFQSMIHTALIATAVFYGLGFLLGELARQTAVDGARREFQDFMTKLPPPKARAGSKPANP